MLSERIVLFFIIAFCLVALSAAYLGEYRFGLTPCKLCLYQRYTLVIAVFLASVCLFLPRSYRAGIFAASLLFFITAGIAFYQVALEKHLIEASCLSTQVTENVDALREQLLQTPLVECDQVQWSFHGISLAGFNGIFNLLMAILCLAFNVSRKR